MRLTTCLLIAALAPTLAGCAPPAAQVPPIFTWPPPDYGRSCEELAAARARLTDRLLFASLRQNSISQADRTRTLGIPTPFGTPFEENQEFDLGVLKDRKSVV
jgi:hypothetical protein